MRLKSNLLIVAIILTLFSSVYYMMARSTQNDFDLPERDYCDKVIREAVTKYADKKEIGNPTFLDYLFTEKSPNIYYVLVSGDTTEGLYNFTFDVLVEKGKTCKVKSLKQTDSYPHEG